MKQILFSLILISLILVSKGQKAKIEYGFQSGSNISTAYGNGISKDYRSPLTGLHVGGQLKIFTANNWGFKFLMSYDQIGWKYKSILIENSAGTGLVNADISSTLNYLNMPVLAEYSFGKKIKINVDGGFFLGILLNNKIITQLKQPIPPDQVART
ncbi:MAG TPA: outer membrane beta-barrel protein, partial [Phnomibacter sp.]|nr:outer membrane beta-barrel protein [Phnomibacter sp.]